MKKIIPLSDYKPEDYASSKHLLVNGFYTKELNPKDLRIIKDPYRHFSVTADYVFFAADTLENSIEDTLSLRDYLAAEKEEAVQQMYTGAQLVNWDKVSKHCGYCGQGLRPHPVELAKLCGSCQRPSYPQIQPVAIVLVKRDTDLLLAKGPVPKKFYSCLAGFVESGESVEECAIREVKEEVGVEIHNLQYFGSQAWPFPNNIMFAFIADWKSGDIVIDKNELSDAAWFSQESPPEILPSQVSIARKMIDSVWQ